jgi:hypothetical protein
MALACQIIEKTAVWYAQKLLQIGLSAKLPGTPILQNMSSEILGLVIARAQAAQLYLRGR